MRKHFSLSACGAALTAAAVLAAIPALAAAHPRPAATATPIKHVVVIYLENHSFDNVLGFWCDANPGRCPDGGMPSSVRLSNGTVVPPSTDPDTVPQVNHSIASQQAAMDCTGGSCAMDGWQNIPTVGKQLGCGAAENYDCISGYQPAQIPSITALAQDFAISDETFSMADSPSWGGHLYAVAANMDGFTGDNPFPAKGFTSHPGWGCDSFRTTPWHAARSDPLIRVPSCVPDYKLGLPYGGAYEPTPVPYEPTIMDRLAAKRLGWRIYGAHSGQGGYVWATCPTFAECLDTAQAKQVVSATQFPADAMAGKLPAFTLVTPGGSGSVALNSCHNGTSMTACDNWVAHLVSAVENGPQWSSTAIFITWDDCGCFYDQVPPPANLNADGQQGGPRVPLIIVSPYAKPGFTDTTPTSFAGILAYVEQNFGLAPLAANDKAAYPFTNAFAYSRAPLRQVKLAQRPLPASAKRIRMTPALANDPS